VNFFLQPYFSLVVAGTRFTCATALRALDNSSEDYTHDLMLLGA